MKMCFHNEQLKAFRSGRTSCSKSRFELSIATFRRTALLGHEWTFFNFRSTFLGESKKISPRREKDAESLVLYLTTQQLEASNLKII